MSQAEVVTLEVPAKPKLPEIEERLLGLPPKSQRQVEIWLPTDIGASFFLMRALLR